MAMGGCFPFRINMDAMTSVRAAGYAMLCSMSSHTTSAKENMSHCLLMASSLATYGAIQRSVPAVFEASVVFRKHTVPKSETWAIMLFKKRMSLDLRSRWT